MHEQLTCRAHQAMKYAAEMARKARCKHIWPRHILLGLLDDPSSRSCVILRKIGVNISRLRELVEATQGSEFGGARDQEGHADTGEVLRHAKKEADKADYDHVGTQHLLAGLLQVDCGVVTALLLQFGVTLDAVHREIHLVIFALDLRVLSSQARDVGRRDIERNLLASLKRYDRLIDELDREVFDAAHDPGDTNQDRQQDRAQSPDFQPEVRIARDEVMADRNALASILRLKPRSPHSFEPRDY